MSRLSWERVKGRNVECRQPHGGSPTGRRLCLQQLWMVDETWINKHSEREEPRAEV